MPTCSQQASDHRRVATTRRIVQRGQTLGVHCGSKTNRIPSASIAATTLSTAATAATAAVVTAAAISSGRVNPSASVASATTLSTAAAATAVIRGGECRGVGMRSQSLRARCGVGAKGEGHLH